MSKKFSMHNEDRQAQILRFQQVMRSIDKKVIMEAFKIGLDIGFFKGRTPNDDLYLQFNDGYQYIYTIIRMPISNAKRSTKSNVLGSVIEGGRKF